MLPQQGVWHGCRWLILVVAMVALTSVRAQSDVQSPPPPQSQPAQTVLPTQQRVKNSGLLLLTSYHRGYRWNDDVVEHVSERFGRLVDDPTQLQVVWLDALRLPTEEAEARLVERLAATDMDSGGGLIISDDPAMAFYLDHRQQFDWPRRAVALGLNSDELRAEAEKVGVRMLRSYPVMAQSLNMLLDTFGSPLNLILLGDDTEHGVNVLDDLTEVIDTLPDVALIDTITGWDPEQVARRMEQAPPNTRLYMQGGQDSGWVEGETTTESRLKRLAELGYPVFCHFDFQVVIGCAGGAILDVALLAHAAVDVALSPAFELVPSNSSMMAQRRQVDVRWYSLFDGDSILPFEWIGVRGRLEQISSRYRVLLVVVSSIALLSLAAALWLLWSREVNRRRRQRLMVDGRYDIPTLLALETRYQGRRCAELSWMFSLASPALKQYQRRFGGTRLEWLFGINLELLRYHLPADWKLYLGDELQLLGVVPSSQVNSDVEALVDSYLSLVSQAQQQRTLHALHWHACVVRMPVQAVDLGSCLRALEEGMERLEREGWVRPTLKVLAVEPYQETWFRWLSRQVGALMDDPGTQWRLVAQPKVSPLDRRLQGVEVLTRWQHPEVGNIEPREFMPVIIMLGLAERFDRWVIHTTLEWLACQPDVHGWLGSMSINVHLSTLMDETFPDHVIQQVRRLGLRASMIELELVEHEHFDDIEKVQAQMTRLRELGIGGTLDDFGSGYTAFQLVQRLPLTAIKLDYSLLHAARRFEQARQAYAALAAFCDRLGLKVVAEGVETHEDARWLITLGIQSGQGYFFARPMELDELVARYAPGSTREAAPGYPVVRGWRQADIE